MKSRVDSYTNYSALLHV